MNLKNIQDAAGYSLKSLVKEDMEKIREIRNAQIDVLRQKHPLSSKEQADYFENIILPNQKKESPDLILFSFFKDDLWIGYGGLTNLNWDDKRGEISFLIETKRSKNLELYETDFLHFLKLISNLAFSHLGLNRLYTETFDFRTFTIDILEKFGFQYEGTLKEHLIIKDVFHDSILHALLARNFDNKD